VFLVDHALLVDMPQLLEQSLLYIVAHGVVRGVGADAYLTRCLPTPWNILAALIASRHLVAWIDTCGTASRRRNI
jgi:hypothetical protein